MRPGIRKLVVALLVVLGLLAVTLFVVVPLAFKPFRIPTESMQPTIELGDRVLVRRMGDYTPERGDIVVSHPTIGAETAECGVPGFEPVDRRQACPRPVPGESQQSFIQRIVALGGDRLRIEGGRAIVDGKPLDEPYAALDPVCDLCNLPREITIPRDHVFVMGDNRGASADSRLWGPLPESSIVGGVSARYWPPSRIGSP